VVFGFDEKRSIKRKTHHVRIPYIAACSFIGMSAFKIVVPDFDKVSFSDLHKYFQ